MKLPRIFTLGLLFIIISLSSKTQVLLSYGGSKVTKNEFLRAFSKNNTDKHPTEKSYRDYLELFIRFKLKVKTAYDLKVDTLPAQQSELENFERQISEGYLRDENSFQHLVNEAFNRSLRDIRLGHIYIPFSDTKVAGESKTLDSAKARRLVMAAYDELRKGSDFKEVARKYSADSSVLSNGGDIGYITLFTLPYELESIVYNTPLGKFSTPFRSGTGYHIFKTFDERNAIGRIKVAQILLAFPPGASQDKKTVIRLRADSVYHALKAGASFSEMARKFSNDNSSYLNNGELPEFGVGTFAPAFEEQVFALPGDGALSEPILTEQGYHLVKRLALNKVNTDPANDSAMVVLRQQVTADPRIEDSRKRMVKKLTGPTRFKQVTLPGKLLWEYADSMLLGKKPRKAGGLTGKTLLFSFPDHGVYLSEWISTLQFQKPLSGTLPVSTYQKLLDEFRDEKILEYYRDHLDTYNPEFAALAKEFKEGNLLFEMMQRFVWDKASADSAGLEAFYQRNKGRYLWESAADAVIFGCSDSLVANQFRAKLEANKNNWETVLPLFENKVTADSGRFEISQLPVNIKDVLPTGKLSPLFNNESESSVSFVYIVKLYPKNVQRSFEEARGFVVNDYQGFIEENWIKGLKKKYRVQVNESVLRTLWK